MPGFRAAAAKEQSDSKGGVLPNSISHNTELREGEGIGSNKLSYAASAETFDRLEIRELSGTLGTLCKEGGTQLLREVEIWLASARFVLAFVPTVPGVSRLARK